MSIFTNQTLGQSRRWCRSFRVWAEDASAYAKQFSGTYAHRVIKGGIGHNLPQEAPEAFAEAVLEVNGY